ncbi:Copper resistance protein C precursor [Clavibacter michiganensis subsp. michiganensis]|uniref:Copper resistance protein C n=1 Tax=Clavibacter michiganensis subsp. michiganensis TaxID=33013 RepID=A0A251XJU9_CLAMM|nr:Copper resistance protein C precursor [Clavibacter michiganensis subsp. michiganensis]OUE03473.1 Copper resistance protein C precursor [Clavibacter michiganensis subsp. michiganensis]
MASPHHPRTPSLLRRAALAAGAAALVLGGALIPAGAASAHDRLVGSTPAADATVTDEPGTIALDFSEELLALDAQASGFAIQVVNASDGSFHEDGCVAVDGSTATTRIALGTAGTYQVTWRAVSSDSHPIDGTYSFTYAPTGDTTGTPAITSAPACGDAWAGSAATATPEPEGTMTTQGAESVAPAPTSDAQSGESVPLADAAETTPVWVFVLIGLVILAAAVLVVVGVVRRSSRRFPGEDGESVGGPYDGPTTLASGGRGRAYARSSRRARGAGP